MEKESLIKGEVNIVWLEDPMKYTYLREGAYATSRKSGKIRRPDDKDERIIGYAEHRKGERGALYYRRVWRIRKYDRDLKPDGPYAIGHPVEAVVPASIRVGQKSVSFRETKVS